MSASELKELLGPSARTAPRKNSFLEPPSQNTVINKIEKHISDVIAGNGDASKDVVVLLSQQQSNASTILSQTNPKALSMYSGYLSAFRYDRAARFVNAVEYNMAQISTITGNKKDQE